MDYVDTGGFYDLIWPSCVLVAREAEPCTLLSVLVIEIDNEVVNISE